MGLWRNAPSKCSAGRRWASFRGSVGSDRNRRLVFHVHILSTHHWSNLIPAPVINRIRTFNFSSTFGFGDENWVGLDNEDHFLSAQRAT